MMGNVAGWVAATLKRLQKGGKLVPSPENLFGISKMI